MIILVRSSVLASQSNKSTVIHIQFIIQNIYKCVTVVQKKWNYQKCNLGQFTLHTLNSSWCFQELPQWVGWRHSCLRLFGQRAKLQTCPRTWAWTARACWCSAGLCREKGVSTRHQGTQRPLVTRCLVESKPGQGNRSCKAWSPVPCLREQEAAKPRLHMPAASPWLQPTSTGAGRFTPKFLGNLLRVSLKIYDWILLEARTSIMLTGLFLLTKWGSKSIKNTSLFLRGMRCRPFPQPVSCHRSFVLMVFNWNLTAFRLSPEGRSLWSQPHVCGLSRGTRLHFCFQHVSWPSTVG